MKKYIFILLIIVIALLSFLFFYKRDTMTLNEYDDLKLSHIIVNSENLENNLKSCITYSFYNDICISERIKYTFENNENAKIQYDMWMNTDNSSFENILLKDNLITFNANVNIGKNKEDILNSCENAKKVSTTYDYTEI